MTFGYIRVSTEKQTLANQKLEIRKHCKKHRIHIDQWIEETVSGTRSPDKRKLGELINICKSGDTIICTEISRLGRSLVMIFSILEKLMDKGVKVITIKDEFMLGDDIQSKVLAFAFGISAEIERKLISERTKQGIARARLEGKQIGRMAGQKPTKYKLSGKDNYIKRRLNAGVSKMRISRELGVTWLTLDNYIKRNHLMPRNSRPGIR